MDIIAFGISSFRIKGKSASIITDPFDSEISGLKFPKTETDIVTVSADLPDHNHTGSVSGDFMVIDGPGEYEVKGVEIIGLAHEKNIIFLYKIDNLTLVHLGDLREKLNDKEKETLNGADILMIPVGGGETLSAETASQVISQIEPVIIIPMHYKTEKLNSNYAGKLTGVDLFLKQMGKEEISPLPKFNVTRDKIPAEPTIVVLE